MAKSERSERNYRGESPLFRAAARRKKLLDAALEIYGEQGLQSVTVKSVCDGAGLTQRYFYESFSNTDDLVIKLYVTQVELLKAHALQSINFLDPYHVVLNDCLTAIFEYLYLNRNAAQVVFPFALNVRQSMRKTHREENQRAIAMFKHMMMPMMPSSQPPELDLDLIIEISWGAVKTAAIEWMIDDYKAPLSQVVYNVRVIFEAIGHQVLGIPDLRDQK